MVRDFLMSTRKIGRGRIRTMFHAVPSERYAPVPRERVEAIKGFLGANGRTRIVGTLTKLGPQRGNEYLLSAAAAVLEVLPELLFLIVYKPTYFHRLPNQSYVPVSGADIHGKAADLQSLAGTLGISKNVRFIEWSENVDDWISACDLIVAPFLSDRFSSVNLLEAMATGKPVVATDLGEQREIIEHGIDGYLVPPGNVKQMTDRILQLLESPQELKKMGQQARKKSEEYCVGAYVQKLERLYEELVICDAAEEKRA
jgi:glycosyltransferase involved in cell wall biosynthesis